MRTGRNSEAERRAHFFAAIQLGDNRKALHVKTKAGFSYISMTLKRAGWSTEIISPEERELIRKHREKKRT